jgi:proteasome lid subunit RPN8/RPN11
VAILSTPFRLQLPRRLYEEMLAHARAELPNECCGVVSGQWSVVSGQASVVRAERCYPLVNELASPTEYLSEPRSMFRAVKDMRVHGTEIVAVYHSHPTSEPVPSQKDLERRYSSAVVHFIISLKDPQPLMRGWWLAEEQFAEADWEVLDGD